MNLDAQLFEHEGPLQVHAPFPAPGAVWPAGDRGALAGALRQVGVTLTECSDARELAGIGRCSESPPAHPLHPAAWVMGDGLPYLVRVRRERAWLTGELSRPEVRNEVATARQHLGIHGANVATWRLPELIAAYRQVRLLQLRREAADARDEEQRRADWRREIADTINRAREPSRRTA